MRYLTVLLFVSVFCYAQDSSRGLKPREYVDKLPQVISMQRPKAKIKPAVKNAIKYKVIGTDGDAIDQGVNVGFTFWRLVESGPGDDAAMVEKSRLAVRKHNADVRVDAIAQRVESTTEFADGDEIRFSIEVPIAGYVYLINRERYIDGSYSDPYLIFPSSRDVGRTDKVTAGKLLFLPSDSETFVIMSYVEGKPRKEAEVFTVIVSPHPLAELAPLGDGEQLRRIDPRKFAEWSKEWGGRVWSFEQEGSTKAKITRAEKMAYVAGKGTINVGDAFPQTIYRVEVMKDKPLLFNVLANIRQR
ncbi:MAG: DUF4384 domain-containing protein [Acidobacteriota bacterium]|nr:DUF4384 domain-containing protein [Blastocatellia bacterium]MDW8412973.1 DUF4384 domain-containing protein [Acidobacteriota bacterium]